MPELSALELLLSVARLGSLGQAAKEHGISQPAAGSRIRYLERLVGLSLIERSPRGSHLTPEGAVVADWARDVIRAASALDTGVAALRAERNSRIRVAASMTIAEYLVPSWLVELRRRHPQVAVSLQVANSAQVAQLVLDGEVDVGFVEGPNLPDGLSARTVGIDELRVVVAPGHPWARRRRPVSAATLANTSLVHREPGSGTRYTLEEVLGAHGELAAPLFELSSTAAIKSAVEAGAGPAVLSSLAVAEDLAAHRLVGVPVEGVDLHRTLRMVWPTGRQPTGALRDVIAVVGASEAPTTETTGSKV
ncbi:molybdate transport repressor ModE-like protein [Tamaricihabitans halophyticus]|uniref:Molybdate transport repressor ModE-like protein n=2 Tax=Tamaricihabitans halophyticus TaxID=1262583 RepID=A0A4R2QQ67_9PSEU|nr:molybdate transport repressor ModE-like protein [Tamaricihabitans halophyticus]